MKNWAGNVSFQPLKSFMPKNLEEIQEIVKEARKENKSVRLMGSGHSWTGLIESQEYFVQLDALQGIISTDKKNQTITAHAGTKLAHFGPKAHAEGLALPNQGDIDKQSLAGALSTGTHGTGINLQSMSNQIKELKLITAKGEVLTINEKSDADLFQAARLSLGSLGIITELTLNLVPAFKLKSMTFPETMKLAMEQYEERLKNHRHLEMFYFPVGDWSMIKIMDETQEAPTSHGLAQKFNDVVLENWLYEQLNRLAVKTKKYQMIDSFMRKFVSHQVKVGQSHKIFPTERTVKFMEMEYNVPLEKFEQVFEEIKRTIRDHKFQTLFPIEIRFVKKDPIWLSPAYERDSAYFAVHTYITEDFRPYFEALQKVFLKHQGRPHWGKWHSLTDNELRHLYPKWENFKNLRRQMDPKGLFLNSHLKSVFGEV